MYQPWAKFLYHGDGTLSDRSELNRPRYVVTFNRIPIFEVGTYQFHFRGMPHEQMTLVLHIESPSLHEDELKSLQTAIEATLVDSRANDICKSSRRPGLNDQDSAWVLSGFEFWHRQCHDFQAHPTESYELTIRITRPTRTARISGKATLYLLERSGYVKVREGTNGFSCFVDRQTPWNSEPTCFDAEGTATTLPTRLFAEAERAKGKSEEQIKTEIDEGYRSGRFKAPSKPGIGYMMSDSVLILVSGNQIAPAPPHLMFYSPYATDKDIGSPSPAANMPHLIRAGQPVRHSSK